MEENNKLIVTDEYKEIISSSESIISLLLANGAEEFTDKVKTNDDYILVGSFIYGKKFADAIKHNWITSFSLKEFERTDGTHTKFVRYKICLRITLPNGGGARYFCNDFGVGYHTKELCEQLSGKLNGKTDNLPIEWLNNLKVEIKQRKSDGTKYYNAELINLGDIKELVG